MESKGHPLASQRIQMNPKETHKNPKVTPENPRKVNLITKAGLIKNPRVPSDTPRNSKDTPMIEITIDTPGYSMESKGQLLVPQGYM